MLNDREITHNNISKKIRISGFPPEGWHDLTTIQQFDEIADALGYRPKKINSIQFDY